MRSQPAVAVQLGDAEMPKVLRVLLLGEDDARAVLLVPEPVDDLSERALEDVVGEHHGALAPVDEPLGQPERLRDPPRPLLVAEDERVDPVPMAVAEEPQELACVRAAGHDHDLVDPGAGPGPRSRTRSSAGRRSAAGACS